MVRQNNLPSSAGSDSMTHELLHIVAVFQEILTCRSISKFPRHHILYLIVTSILSLEVNREGIIILLSGTRKPRYLRVREHDCGCTRAGGGVKIQTENFFFPFITFDLFQSILIPLCLFRFVWYFVAWAKWGTPHWMPIPAASDSYRKTPLALTGNSNRSCYFWDAPCLTSPCSLSPVLVQKTCWPRGLLSHFGALEQDGLENIIWFLVF